MKKLMFARSFVFACFVMLGLCCPLFAQITIEWQEIPHIVNTCWTKNYVYDANVDLGGSGGPQTWTFTSQPMGTDSCTNVIFPVNQAPFHDSFPNANLVYASLEGTDSAFLYMQLEPGFVSTLGIVGTTSSGVFMKYDPVDTNDLPEHYNDSRHYYTAYIVGMGAGAYALYQKKGFEHINAYGTVVIPYGSFPCLRYVLYDTLVQIMYYNGIPVFYDTTTRILHQFVAENRSGVVCVISHEDETNPYFTNASILERLTYFSTGIEEVENSIARECRVTVHPNPFHSSVTFTYDSETAEPATMEIYNAQGRLMRTFTADAGCKAVFNWAGDNADGVRVPGGVYFYRILSGDRQVTGKIVRTR
jgi:hypothetical protein